jgi:acyl-CoA synthetase (NDP forming)
MFTTLPLPRGDRIVLFSTSGGATVLTTDLAAASGLNFPPLTQATNDALQEILAVERPFTNPFDVVGAPRLVKGSNMTRCLQTILADDSVDLVGCVLVVPRDATPQRQTLLDQVKSVLPGPDKPGLLLSACLRMRGFRSRAKISFIRPKGRSRPPAASAIRWR